MLVTLTSSRLFQCLLSLVIRLRLSAGRIVHVLRTRFASLWRSILTLASRRSQRQIRLAYASDAAVLRNHPASESVEEEGSATVGRPAARWQDILTKYQVLTSRHKFKFDPATPEEGSQRYRSRTVNRDTEPPAILPGQQRLLRGLPSLPDEWRRYVHPEGNVTFYHQGLRIFTENDIFRREKDILFCATKLILEAIDTDGVALDELTEIVLNVDNNHRCRYYFVDHTHRLLFWLVPRSVYDLGATLEGITEYSHIRYMVEAQYWYGSSSDLPGMSYIVYDMESRSHCEYYPHGRTLPKGVFKDLRGMLNYAKTDMMTTDSSSSPFGQDELVAILDLVNSLKDDEKISDSYSVWVIARLMAYFTENQFSNFCGQPCARLNADTALFGKQDWNRHILFRALNLSLFGFPNGHAVRLQRVWVDGIIIQPRWKDFINRLTSELGRYTIFSTVMLTVNFSFLAVPGVVDPSRGSVAGPIQIIIYCSIVSTVASIVFSFALLNVYSNPGLLGAGGAGFAAGAMRRISQLRPGMGCLAITHSLPIASLIWSIALFSTALAIQIFGPKHLATIVTLGVECFIIVSFAVAGSFITRQLSGSDDVDDVDPAEKILSPEEKLHFALHDVERGADSMN